MDSTKLNLTLSALKWYKIRVKQIWSLSLFIHFLQNLPDFDWFWPTLIFSQDQVKLIISWWITMLYHKVRYGNGAWHHWHAIQIDKCCHRMCSHEICPLFYVCGPHSNNSGSLCDTGTNLQCAFLIVMRNKDLIKKFYKGFENYIDLYHYH